jgi:hypothetical protein
MLNVEKMDCLVLSDSLETRWKNEFKIVVAHLTYTKFRELALFPSLNDWLS